MKLMIHSIAQRAAVIILRGWWGCLLSLVPVYCVFSVTHMAQFVELFFFVGLILADLKRTERWLNVSIYVLISMTISGVAFRFYAPDFDGLCDHTALTLFWTLALAIFWLRSWLILRRQERTRVDLQLEW